MSVCKETPAFGTVLLQALLKQQPMFRLYRVVLLLSPGAILSDPIFAEWMLFLLLCYNNRPYFSFIESDVIWPPLVLCITVDAVPRFDNASRFLKCIVQPETTKYAPVQRVVNKNVVKDKIQSKVSRRESDYMLIIFMKHAFALRFKVLICQGFHTLDTGQAVSQGEMFARRILVKS